MVSQLYLLLAWSNHLFSRLLVGDNSKNSQRGPGGKSKPGQGGRSKPKPEDKPGAGDKQGPGDKAKPGQGRRPKPGRIQPTSGRRPGKNSIRLDQGQLYIANTTT